MNINDNYENKTKNVKDSRPNKSEMSWTMVGAVVFAISCAAVGIYWFINPSL